MNLLLMIVGFAGIFVLDHIIDRITIQQDSSCDYGESINIFDDWSKHK